jgi:TetR/AcrR family transcriptional regulator, ethionamide resistance regulator
MPQTSSNTMNAETVAPPQDHRTRVAAERRERMRARLCDSALELVARGGPAALTIDEVIVQAEVSRGTFYKYFDRPESLLRDLAIELAEELVRTAEPLVLAHSDPAERLSTGMRTVIGLGVAQPSIGAFLVRMGWPAVGRQHAMFDFALRDLEAGLAIGRFLPLPPALGLNIVSSTVIGAMHALLFDAAGPAFPAQATAAAMRALGVEPAQAERLAAVPLATPAPIAGGLMARCAALALSVAPAPPS